MDAESDDGNGVFGHQFGGTGTAGVEFDGGSLKPDPCCDIATPVDTWGNDGRGDIRDVESFEGDTLRDDGPLIL